MFAKIFEYMVAIGKAGAEFLLIAPSKSGEGLRTNLRKFSQGFSLGYRAVMQDIIPGKINSRKPDLPKGAGDRLSVGDMQHKGKASTKRGSEWNPTLGREPIAGQFTCLEKT
jgi:hypothetical protein